MGVPPGETQDAWKVGVSPGEMTGARKTVINANSQEAFSMYACYSVSLLD